MNHSSAPPTPANTGGLSRQVKSIGLVSFFNDAASEMILPLMPMFVTSVLGLGPHVLGIMEGVAETTASLLKYFSGWWSDKVKKRKPLAIRTYSKYMNRLSQLRLVRVEQARERGKVRMFKVIR